VAGAGFVSDASRDCASPSSHAAAWERSSPCTSCADRCPRSRNGTRSCATVLGDNHESAKLEGVAVCVLPEFQKQAAGDDRHCFVPTTDGPCGKPAAVQTSFVKPRPIRPDGSLRPDSLHRSWTWVYVDSGSLTRHFSTFSATSPPQRSKRDMITRRASVSGGGAQRTQPPESACDSLRSPTRRCRELSSILSSRCTGRRGVSFKE